MAALEDNPMENQPNLVNIKAAIQTKTDEETDYQDKEEALEKKDLEKMENADIKEWNV